MQLEKVSIQLFRSQSRRYNSERQCGKCSGVLLDAFQPAVRNQHYSENRSKRLGKQSSWVWFSAFEKPALNLLPLFLGFHHQYKPRNKWQSCNRSHHWLLPDAKLHSSSRTGCCGSGKFRDRCLGEENCLFPLYVPCSWAVQRLGILLECTICFVLKFVLEMVTSLESSSASACRSKIAIMQAWFLSITPFCQIEDSGVFWSWDSICF